MSEAKTGFTRGFFGCFGAIAAGLLIIVGLLAMGTCSSTGTDLSEPPNSSSGGQYDAASATTAFHCVNGLQEAAERGETDLATTSLAFPWRITGQADADGYTRLTCAAEAGGRPATVIVQAVCGDTDRADCTRLLSFHQ